LPVWPGQAGSGRVCPPSLVGVVIADMPQRLPIFRRQRRSAGGCLGGGGQALCGGRMRQEERRDAVAAAALSLQAGQEPVEAAAIDAGPVQQLERGSVRLRLGGTAV